MYERLIGKVVSGKQLGRTLGFPTLNCSTGDSTSDLSVGTYRVNVLLAGTIYKGIGPRFPERKLFEVHLLGGHHDIASKEVIILPLWKIRDNRSFSSLDELKKQITKDIQRAHTHPQKVITFGTFDYFHPGHEYYLKQAKQYGDFLITIIAKDTTVYRFKGLYPDHTEHERLACVEKTNISDCVVLGDEHNQYKCLTTYRPEVIYLGYDQHSFDDGLRKRCNENNLETTTIIRSESYHPEKRKSSLVKKM